MTPLIDHPLVVFNDNSPTPGLCIDAKGDLVLLGAWNTNLIPGSINTLKTTYSFGSNINSINMDRINRRIESFSRLNPAFERIVKTAYPNLRVGYAHSLFCGNRFEDLSTIEQGIAAFEDLTIAERFDEAEKVLSSLRHAGCNIIPKTKKSIDGFHIFPSQVSKSSQYKIIKNGWYVCDRIIKPAICMSL